MASCLCLKTLMHHPRFTFRFLIWVLTTSKDLVLSRLRIAKLCRWSFSSWCTVYKMCDWFFIITQFSFVAATLSCWKSDHILEEPSWASELGGEPPKIVCAHAFCHIFVRIVFDDNTNFHLLFQFLSVAQNKLKSLSMASQPRLQVHFFALKILFFLYFHFLKQFCIPIGAGGQQK